MFEHILVPLDGSKRAEDALPIAARLARAAGSSVVLLQVVSAPMNYGYASGLGMGYAYGPATALITEEASETEQAQATAYLAGIAHSELLAGIPTSIKVVVGQAVADILALAEQQAANLIVMCSHGQTNFHRWALGSVARRVIHYSRIPVLVLREENSTPLHDACPLRVTVALDGSPLAETALLPAAYLVAELARPAQGIVHLLSVVKAYTPSANYDAHSQRNAEEAQKAQIYLQSVRDRLLTQLKDLNLLVTWSVTPAADAAETIVTIAKRGMESTGGNSCDILAIATHGRGGIERWVMGSVTERVLEASTVPVLVVRPSQETVKS